MKNKIIVAWICHFSNNYIQRKLPLSKKEMYKEFAPWILDTIKRIENNQQIELHIISPYKGLKRIIYSFNESNVNYHFFKPDIPMIHKKIWNIPMSYLNRFIDQRHKYISNKVLVKHLINEIKPDVIHLQGAENAYYSSSILQFKDKYPVLVTIQGFISKCNVKKTDHIRNQIEIEKKILENFKHFGIRTKTMGEDVKSFNQKAVLHWHGYGMKDIQPIKSEKKYDLVFFARVCKDKGIEDLLAALALIKKVNPKISLIVIGPDSGNYINYLMNMAIDLNIKENITWAGFQPTRDDVHRLASQARISVLPTYHDIIPGTIVESMKLCIPVVAYATGSIPEVNEGEKRIEIIERFNIKKMAEVILKLLNDRNHRTELTERALEYARIRFNDNKLEEELICAYKEVIGDFEKDHKSRLI